MKFKECSSGSISFCVPERVKLHIIHIQHYGTDGDYIFFIENLQQMKRYYLRKKKREKNIFHLGKFPF